MTDQLPAAVPAPNPLDQRMLTILECVSDGIVALDTDWRYTYVNAKAAQIFQRRPEDMIGKHIWTEFPAGVGRPFQDACQRALNEQEFIEIEEYYPPYDCWFANRIFPSPDGLTIFFHDISDRKRADALVNGQKQTLEMIATGVPLVKTLDALLRFLERESPGMLCSLLLLDADGLHVLNSVAPSLPEAFNRAFDGLPIGECAGSCGTAAFRREPVIVEDIASDPLWQDYRDLALSHGLRACWSMPIFNAAQRVLGTFAIYYRQPGRPSARHHRIIEIATHLAAIAISRTQDEEALRSSAKRYRSTLDSILEGCQLIGSDWRYLYLNHAAAQHNRRPNDELLGKTMMEASPGIEATEGFALLQRCMDERISLQQEVAFVFPDGSKGYFDVRTQPVSEGIFVLSIDITERKQAEAALVANEARLRLALNAAHVGTFDWDVAGNNIIWSRWHEEMWGYDSGEFDGNSEAFAQRVHPDDIAGINAEVARCIAAREPFAREYRVVWPDGSLHWIQSMGEFVFGDDGQPLRMLGTVVEITARKQAELQLAESESRLRAIVTNEPECVKLLAADGTLLEMNPAGLRMLEADSFEQVKDHCIYPVVVEEYRPAFKALTEKVFAGGSGQVEFELVGLKGGRRWFETHASPLRDASGQVSALLGITRDVTDSKRARDALQRSEQEYRLLFSQNPNPMWVYDQETLAYLAVNDATVAQYGYSREEFLSMTIKDIRPPEDIPRLVAAVAKLPNFRSWVGEWRHRKKDGTLIDVDVYSNVIFFAGRSARIGTSVDVTDRNLAVQGLRASKQLLDDSQSIAKLGGWEIDLASQALSWTDETYRIHETSPGEFSPAVAAGISHYLPGSQRILTDAMRAAVEHGVGYDLELEKLTVKGRRIDVRTTCQVQYLDGKPVKLTGIIQDISERKRVESALVESRQQLAVIIDNIKEGLIVSDLEGKHLSMNPAGKRMHGLTEDEIAAHPLMEFDRVFRLSTLEGDVLPIEQWPLSRILRGEPVENLELRIGRVDRDWQRIFCFSGALARYAEGKAQAFIAVRDVTEDKETEALRLAVTGADIGTWHWNIVTGELQWSERCKAIFGIPADAAMSYARFLEALHPDDRERIDRAVRDAIANREVYRVEMRSVWPDGSVHWAASQGRVFYDAAGNPLRMEGAANDITARKLADAGMQLMNEQLQESNHELRAFSYSVSHDLRAPLRGIDGWSLALLEDYGDQLDAQGREYLQRVRSEAQHMGRLIDSLLQLSRVVQSEMHKAPVNLSGIAEAIVRGLREAEPGRAVEVIVQPGLRANGDAGLLKAALTNLLGNAWKFSRDRSPARIEFGCVIEAGMSTYFVRDNGIGFDMAHASKLFSPFQRMHRQSEFPGTGIGLAIVQRIVGRHGGKIWAESMREFGTTIHFTLGGGE